MDAIVGKGMEWFVLRDLKRANAKVRAWEMLRQEGFEVFTPLKEKIEGKNRRMVPVVNDLLFVHSERNRLDPVVAKTATLQYRYSRGGGYRSPMTVPERAMAAFISAITSSSRPRYFSPEEITVDMIGKTVRIIGGPLNGLVGRLAKLGGMRKKKLFIALEGILVAAVEVSSDYIEYLD